MTTINDARPFADVLRDWMARHSLTAYAAAKILHVREGLIPGWIAGAKVTHEFGLRCAMALHDAGGVLHTTGEVSEG